MTVEHNAPGAFIANIDDAETIEGGVDRAATGTTRRRAPAGARRWTWWWRRRWRRRNAAAAHTPAYWIKVTAQPDGTFTVVNQRNGFSKTYAARPK